MAGKTTLTVRLSGALSEYVSANILLNARFSDLPQHQAAREWLDRRLNDPEPTGIPWNSLTAFARIASNRRVFSDPLDSHGFAESPGRR